MESEKSTKRAVLAAAACEGIYLAIGIAVQIIATIVAIILTAVSNSGGSVAGAAALALIILSIAAIPIAYLEYKLAMRLIPKIAENTPTEILGFRILGWLLIGLNVVDFFLSVSDQSSASVAGIVIGILYIRHAKKLDKDYSAAKEARKIQKVYFATASDPAPSEALDNQHPILSQQDIPDDDSYV